MAFMSNVPSHTTGTGRDSEVVLANTSDVPSLATGTESDSKVVQLSDSHTDSHIDSGNSETQWGNP